MNILYITPQKPRNSGITDYSAKYVEIIQKNTKHTLEFHKFPEDVLYCYSDIRQLIALFKHVRKQREIVNSGKYDLIHCEIGNNGFIEYYFISLLSLKTVPIPIVITFHDPPHLILNPFQYFGLNKTNIISRVFRKAVSLAISYAMESFTIRNSKLVFIHTEAGKLEACRRFPQYKDKFITVPTFLYTHTLIPKKKEDIILGAGYWGKERGYEQLIDAVILIRSKQQNALKDWRIYLCGGILDEKSLKYYKKIKMRIQEEKLDKIIKAIVNLPINDFEDAFLRASIFVSTEKVTGRVNVPASSVLLRAIGSGCALIVADTPGKNEFVTNGQNGYLFQHDNVAALVDVMLKLLSSKETIKSFQKQNIYLCKTRHNEITLAQIYSSYYNKLKYEAGAK